MSLIMAIQWRTPQKCFDERGRSRWTTISRPLVSIGRKYISSQLSFISRKLVHIDIGTRIEDTEDTDTDTVGRQCYLVRFGVVKQS